MDRAEIIRDLKTSGFTAECPIGCVFNLSEAIIFDGTKPFPKEALEYKKALLDELEERKTELAKQRKLATDRAEITTKAVNVGKNLEKIFPILENFKWELPDARFLGDPIDLLIFEGLSHGVVDSINFVEVKTGKARLNSHQKMVKDAIDDEKIGYKVFK